MEHCKNAKKEAIFYVMQIVDTTEASEKHRN